MLRSYQAGLCSFFVQIPRAFSPRCRGWLWLAGASWLLVAQSHANTYSWQGLGSSGNWNDSANWGGAGVPANGDSVIFPPGQPRPSNTNNLSNLTLSQIRFWGSNYFIYGNSLTVTNSIVSTNLAGANMISNAITLATADVTVNVGSGASLALAGTLSGSVGATKSGLVPCIVHNCG